MADIATLQLRLAEAELAYHRLATGSAEVTVEHDDMKVTYNTASVPKLQQYIADLRSQLRSAGVLDATQAPRRRPIYPVV